MENAWYEKKKGHIEGVNGEVVSKMGRDGDSSNLTIHVRAR